MFLSAGGHNPSSAAELDLLVIGFKQQNSLTCSALELLIASLELWKVWLIPSELWKLWHVRKAPNIRCPCVRVQRSCLRYILQLRGTRLVLQTLTGLRPSELLGLRERHILRPTVDCPRFIFRLGVGTGTKVQREQTTYLEWGCDVEVSKLLRRLVHCTHDSDFLFPLAVGSAVHSSFSSCWFCNWREC